MLCVGMHAQTLCVNTPIGTQSVPLWVTTRSVGTSETLRPITRSHARILLIPTLCVNIPIGTQSVPLWVTTRSVGTSETLRPITRSHARILLVPTLCVGMHTQTLCVTPTQSYHAVHTSINPSCPA